MDPSAERAPGLRSRGPWYASMHDKRLNPPPSPITEITVTLFSIIEEVLSKRLFYS